MTKKIEFGDVLDAAHSSEETIGILRSRRSTAADLMDGTGPDPETLQVILEIAARIPDHRCVVPFRFIVFEGGARARAGAILAVAFRQENPDAEAARVEKEAARFMRAGVVVAVVASTDPDHRTPEWEQIMTAGAACQNMLIAANAHGLASQWLTEWYAFNRQVLSEMGIEPDERIAGFVYISGAKERPKERRRPDLAAITSRF